MLGDRAHGSRSQFVLDFSRQWQAAEKIVYSRTLAWPGSARRLKADAVHDIAVDGPEVAARAIRAGLVDEFQTIVCPVVVGSGNGSSRMVCGWIWNWSRSDASARAWSF